MNQNDIITEIDYPIQKRWILKIFISNLSATVSASAFVLFFHFFISLFPNGYAGLPLIFKWFLNIFLIIGVYIPFSNALQAYRSKKKFHFALHDTYIFVTQGWYTSNERQTSYDGMQDVTIKQDVLDRMFGLAMLVITNVSNTSANIMNMTEVSITALGALGNKISIAGLKIKDAESLRDIIASKIREHANSSSGL